LTDYSVLTIQLTIPLYNSATIQLTIRLTILFFNSALPFRLRFRLTIWLTKTGETIRASEQRLCRGPKRVSRVDAFDGGR